MAQTEKRIGTGSNHHRTLGGIATPELSVFSFMLELRGEVSSCSRDWYDAAMLSDADIQRIATLARLRVPPSELAATREKLWAVVAYVEQLQKLDLKGVEPLAHVGDAFNRLDADVARAAMPRELLGAIAPATHEETTPDGTDVFVRIPKVIKKDGGARGDGATGGGA